MRFELLGPLGAVDGERPVPLGSPQQQKLLALLLTSPDQIVSVDRLIDEIWAGEPPPSAAHLVQVYASRLRGVLGDLAGAPRIVRDGPGYRIRLSPDDLDAARLETALAEAEELIDHDPATAYRLLDETTPDLRSRPLGELADESPALKAAARRLEELRLRATEDRMDAALRLGRHEDVAMELAALTGLHPFRERLWAQRMLALYRSGRQADALSTAAELRSILLDELGIDPSPDVQDLEERILLQDPTLRWEPPPPPSNLPERPTTFVGRDWEVAAIAKQIDAHRLVTLTGPGGAGKTRLAIETAERIRSRFPDGVWWVDLAPVDDPDQVTATLAGLLGSPHLSATENLVSALAPRTALLVIDNCEHLVEPVATLAGALLRGTPAIRVIATSRSPLKAEGEVLWAVPSLSMPERDGHTPDELLLSDAVRLLVERGVEVDRTFALTADNAGVAVDLCRRLDALPLAIEMAAARLRALSLDEIEAGLADRFDFLIGSGPGTDRRQGTLAATCEWSYQLLEPSRRRLFDHLSVFAGAFDLEAAAAVGASDDDQMTVMEAVTGLVEASMLATERRPAGIRYRMLETLRDFGARHLAEAGEADSIRQRHAGYFLGLTAGATDAIGTPEFASWSRRLSDGHDDLRRALDWSLAHHPREQTLQAAPALFYHWYRTGNAPEAARWSAAMLDGADDAPATLRGWAHLAAGFACQIVADEAGSEEHTRRAVELLEDSEDPRGAILAWFGRANGALAVSDLETVTSCARRSLDLCEASNHKWLRAGPLALLSFGELFGGGTPEEALRLGLEAVEIHRRLEDTAGLVTMNLLVPIYLGLGDLEQAERWAIQITAWAVGSGWEAQSLVILGEVQMAQGALDRAERTIRRGMRRAVEAGLENWFRLGLRDLAQIAVRRHDPDLAALLTGASRRNMPDYPMNPAVYAEIEAFLDAEMSAEERERLETRGHAMTHRELLEIAGPSTAPE